MQKNRLEAFSDGVIAILITIMVLELKTPHSGGWQALRHLLPIVAAYALSFVYLAIYWNNHHHMFHMVHHVNGAILWANLHLLFWLSLVPFATAWMGATHLARLPTFTYGTILLFCGISYYILQRVIIHSQGKESKLKAAVGKDLKGKASVVLYLVSLPLVYVEEWLAIAIYVAVALWWIVPDRRIESFKH